MLKVSPGISAPIEIDEGFAAAGLGFHWRLHPHRYGKPYSLPVTPCRKKTLLHVEDLKFSLLSFETAAYLQCFFMRWDICFMCILLVPGSHAALS